MTSGGVTQLMDLPEEVRRIIIQNIPQSQTLNLRLVSRQWNADVDNHFNFDITNLDERSPSFTEILKVRIKTLNILQLVERSVVHPGGVCIFHHPNAIRNLKISNGTSDRIEGKEVISPRNLQLLFNFCNQNLEELSLDLAHSVFNYQAKHPWKPPDKFGNIKRLEIFIKSKASELPEIRDKSTNFLKRLLKLSMPKLRHLNLSFCFHKFDEESRSNLILSALSFVANNEKHLESLTLLFRIYDPGQDGSSEVPILAPKYLALLENYLKCINKLDKLKSIWIRKLPEERENSYFWQLLISHQRHLVNVKLKRSVRMPLDLCRQLVLHNYSTLATVEIGDLAVPSGQPLDLAVFQNCQNLQVLRLTNKWNSHTHSTTNRTAVNMASLPPNLTELYLNTFELLSEDLLAFSTGRRFGKLQLLLMIYCGTWGEFGVNGSVLEALLDRAMMNSLKEIGISCGINYSDIEECEKFNAVLTAIGYPGVEDGLFCVRVVRDSVEDQWHSYYSLS